MSKSFIFDLETLGKSPDGVILDISCLVVDLNKIQNPPTFEELVSSAKNWKLDVKDQLKNGRKTDSNVLDWWKNKSEEAKQVLKTTGTEVTLNSALDDIGLYLYENGFDRKTGLGYCRGQSFDFPLIVDAISKKHNTTNTLGLELCHFWNQRDIRTAISGILLDDKKTNTPLRKGILNGFVKHNSIHDIAKDALMIIYAKRYALGLEDPPSIDDTDEVTL